MTFEGFDPADLAFPQQAARTRSYTLGIARNIEVSPDGARVVYLRSKGATDPVTCLWVLDVASGEERCVFDPRDHEPDLAEPTLTPAERARRERLRERAGGVTAFAHDRDLTTVVFVERGRLFRVDLRDASARELPTDGVVDDPRLSPDGTTVAYVLGGDLLVQGVDDAEGRVLASDPSDDVTWGLADFVAAEEMNRYRGSWWSPDGSTIAACRVDDSNVLTWWIGEPSDPARRPYPIRYPQTGTRNPDVTLHLLDVGTGAAVEVTWDRAAFEYLARVDWPDGSPLTLLVESRDQTRTWVLEVDPATGATTLVREDTDPLWLDLVHGVPTRMGDGALVTTADVEGRKRVIVGEAVATPPSMHVLAVLDADDDAVWFTAAEDDPAQRHVYRVRPGDETERVSVGEGLHTASVGHDVVVLTSWLRSEQYPTVVVRRRDGSTIHLESASEAPVVDPRPEFVTLGERQMAAALLLPAGHDGSAPLPVLMCPYGGPGFGAVMAWRGAFREEQYFADRLSAAVLVVDGRGTPGRGHDWERAIHHDFPATLDDQVDGLRAAAERWTFLDLERVAIRGWSYGGWISAFAVITRPDVFRAGVAGAPVSDFRLYDTHYTERYYGMPDDHADAYDAASPLKLAANLTRPLLLIHGFADDNVVMANTLRLSTKLFEAGIHHELVVLPDASHIGGSGALITGRYLAELDFLRRNL